MAIELVTYRVRVSGKVIYLRHCFMVTTGNPFGTKSQMLMR